MWVRKSHEKNGAPAYILVPSSRAALGRALSIDKKVRGTSDPAEPRKAQVLTYNQLFNAAALCRNLEAIYASIWRQQQLCGAHDELGA